MAQPALQGQQQPQCWWQRWRQPERPLLPSSPRRCPPQVSIARCGSHELFRTAQDAKAVVVLLRRGGDLLPQPHELAAALRSEEAPPDAGGPQPLLD